MKQKAFGPDKLHGSRLADLPPIAQRWKQLHASLRYYRHKLNTQPAHRDRQRWYTAAADILEQRQQLIPQMREAGYRVHSSAGLPSESLRSLQQREILEAIPREQRRATGSIEGWEAFSDGLDTDTPH